MGKEERLQTLRDRHAVLDRQLVQELGRPHPDEGRVNRLKREKLRLKDEISLLEVHPRMRRELRS